MTALRKKGTQLNVRVPEALYRAVQLRAIKSGMTQSEIVRDALIRYLAEQPSASTGNKPPHLQG